MARVGDPVDRRERERRRWSRRGSDAFGLSRDAPRLLVIEPHEDMRTLYRYVFEQTGYLVDAVGDGLSAIGVAQVRLPDVIVMEIVALRPDGFEILSRLRAQSTTSTIPCIVVTGTPQFSERAYAAGAA